MDRDAALELIRSTTTQANTIKHMRAVGAIMAAAARRLGADAQLWELAGLLHDIDYEQTAGDPRRHGAVASELLKGKVSGDIIHAIMAHNFERTGVIPTSAMEKALIAADNVSGLIIACALVMPSRRLVDVRPQTVIDKFKSKDFARAVNRNKILICEQIGIASGDFLQLALAALQGIAGELGL